VPRPRRRRRAEPDPAPGFPPAAAAAAEVFVEGVGREISDTWGRVSDLAGRLFATLYLAGRPMDMDELAHVVGRSKSNVLVNLRTLVSLGLASRTWVPGSRRDLYEVGPDYGNIILRGFFRRLGGNLEANRRAIDTARRQLEAVGRDGGEDPRIAAMRERMLGASRFYDSMNRAYATAVASLGYEVDFVALLQMATRPLDQRRVHQEDQDDDAKPAPRGRSHRR